jgi:hypothetical protein
MGTYTKHALLFNRNLVAFLNIPSNCVTLYELKNIIILNTKYNNKTDMIELTDEYKRFFSIHNNKIHLTSLMSIIVLKYINNNIPNNINYYEYYQEPIEISII